MKSNRNIIIGALVIAILAMSIGYSAFASQLTINGTAQITGVWDVRITGIEATQVSEGCDGGEPQYTNTTATFNAKLQKPGDIIKYLITIRNEGTIDAALDDVLFQCDEESGSPAISYSTTNVAKILNAGEETTLEITITYDPNYTEVPSIKTKTITGIIEYVQK